MSWRLAELSLEVILLRNIIPIQPLLPIGRVPYKKFGVGVQDCAWTVCALEAEMTEPVVSCTIEDSRVVPGSCCGAVAFHHP